MIEALDGWWIEPFREAVAYPDNVAQHLRADDLETPRRIFFESDCTINPDLRPTVDTEILATSRQKLITLKDAIETQEPEAVVREAYGGRIRELLTHLDILEAANNVDTAMHQEASIAAYGEPIPRIFGQATRFFRGKADELAEHSQPQVKDAAKRAQDNLPEITVTSPPLSESDFALLRTLHNTFYDTVLDDLEIPETVGSDLAFDLLRQVLRRLHCNYEVIQQREGVATISVDHVAKLVKLPKNRSYSKEEFIGLVLGHEVKTHIEERINGEQQPLLIVYNGLSQLTRATEGKGVLREQVAYPTFAGFIASKRAAELYRRTLAIGLGIGADGAGPRDFTKVFSIMTTINMLYTLETRPDELNVAQESARRQTWQLMAARTHRGYGGGNMVDLRDKLYLEGCADYQAIGLQVPESFPYWDMGRYDLSNPTHVRILKAARIIPPSLPLPVAA